jgi:hypothetical protein
LALPMLANVAELRDFMGKNDLEMTDGRANFLLEAASALIRSYTHQTISQVTNDAITIWVRRSDQHSIVLPERPVTDVASVELNDEALVEETDFYWTSAGILVRLFTTWEDPVLGWSTWGLPASKVDVVYTHGYPQIPKDIKLACCAIAGSLFERPGAAGPLSSESIGDYSYRVADAAGGQSSLSLTSERLILDRYRMVGVA